MASGFTSSVGMMYLLSVVNCRIEAAKQQYLKRTMDYTEADAR